MINLKDLTIDQLKAFFIENDEKPFRASQVFKWIYRGAQSFDEMTDLSKALRDKLKTTATLGNLRIVRVQNSQTDGTKKYLFALDDDNTIESVFMKYKYGNSICISSQAGCRMGCKFCASALGGLARNLSPGEMADQIISAQRDTGEKITRVVVMGTGEPFDNYQNLTTFINLIHSEEGLNIGLRNITVSTCGLVPEIQQFAKDFPQVNLAISLHGASDEIRSKMMPVNHQYPVKELLNSCRAYVSATHRQITFEYALVDGVNDAKEQIDLLVDMLTGMNCLVNLIPLNQVSETGLIGASRKTAHLIAEYLEKRGISATVRRELGSDIEAACGQLRLEKN